MYIFGKGRKSKLGRKELFLLSLLLLVSFNASALPCADNRCKTGNCSDTGACFCNLPDPSTILEGDRSFLGGRFCNEEQIMCDGTNSSWCEHGATCDEIVHGENYTCKCLPGYSGIHCEHVGAPCGRLFCFHEAECLVEDDVCECPPDWRGSVDCSLPTRTDTEPTTNSTTKVLTHADGKNNTKWLAVSLVISCTIAAVSIVSIYAKRFSKKRGGEGPKFQELSQIQTHNVFDDDEDDSSVSEAFLNDNAHI
ncbi:protein crumbs homolog 1-like [Telopea speciosissima]|uniref:protein crumbs homolog 1-like n=1 Tax=Telopea speciosissima TaxID=54955 RepID=UPI001CC810AC|nr:protein crumbs homolog 1-like [Telopea speciosissima]